MPATPVRSRLPKVGTPPPAGSPAPLPGTFNVHAGAFSRASRFADAYCGRTLLQSHWSSSATIIAFDVHTPWPSSVCAIRIVTVSSGATTIQALTSGVAGSSYQAAPDGFATGVCACALSGTQKPRTKAPCAAATAARNSRRVRSVVISLPHQIGGEMNGLPNTVIRAAPAGVGDARVDVGVGGTRAVVEERQRRHDHPRLAVAALRCIKFLPGHLNRM